MVVRYFNREQRLFSANVASNPRARIIVEFVVVSHSCFSVPRISSLHNFGRESDLHLSAFRVLWSNFFLAIFPFSIFL